MNKKLPGIGCHGEEWKLSKGIYQNLSKMLSCIHRHRYLCYCLFFVFFIEFCAWGKLYFGTPGSLDLLVEQTNFDFYSIKIQFETPEILATLPTWWQTNTGTQGTTNTRILIIDASICIFGSYSYHFTYWCFNKKDHLRLLKYDKL